MTVPHYIQTARLQLRPLVAEDADRLAALINDFDVSKWLTTVPYPYAVQDAHDFLTTEGAAPGVAWAIEEDGLLMGVISYGKELGYWLSSDAWGRGLMTEAGDAVIDAVFANTDRPEITSSYFAENARSGTVLSKLGFVEAGPKTSFSVARGQTVQSHAMRMRRERWRDRRQFRVETDRLTIRELQDEDWQALQTLGGVADVARMLFSVKAPWSEAEVKLWIERSKFRGRTGFRTAVCLKDGPMIGSLGLGRSPGAAEETCAYFLGQDYWGQGYATEAMRGFLTACYDRFDLDIIEADHFTDNPASGRVLQKLGFQRSGEGMGTSAARLEPAPNIAYRLIQADFRAATGAQL
jgi:RimJ/RimL family protein N-acetyltransferase